MTPADSPRPPTARYGGWVMLGILILFYMLNALDRTILSLMVKFVKRDLDVTDGQIGLLLGLAFSLFYGIFGIPAGMLVDRVARRLVLFGGVLLWSLATIACGLTGSFGQLLMARMMLGIGESALFPTAHSLLADQFTARRLSTALSIFYLGGVFGNSFAVAVGGAAIGHFSQFASVDLPLLGGVRGWQMPFLVIGAVGVALAVLAFAFREPARRHDRGAAAGAPSFVRALLDLRALALCMFGSYVLFSMVLYGVVLWTPTYMTRAFGWTPGQIGLGYSIVHLVGGAAGTVLGGVVVDRLFARGRTDAHFRVFGGALLIAGPAGVLAFLSSDPYVFLALESILFFFGFSYAGYAAAAVQTISTPAVRGRMAAVYLLSIVIVGNGLGPWAIGLITDHLFHSEARVGSAIVLLLAIITPISIVSAWLGRKPMRDAVAALTAREERALPPDAIAVPVPG